MNESDPAEKLSFYTKFANQFLREHYGLSLTVPIKINGRLTRTIGRFVHDRRGNPLKVELSRAFATERTEVEVLDVLRHELIHYALFMLGKPSGDSSRAFQMELKKHGVSKTGSYAYRGRAHVYCCNGCGRQFVRIRRISNLNRKVCGSCRSKIAYIGEKYVQD